jgi:hypothetical protein
MWKLLPLVFALAACDPPPYEAPDTTGTGLTCATGTHEQDGTCVADVACGDGTHEDAGSCVPDVECGEGTHVDGDTCVADVIDDGQPHIEVTWPQSESTAQGCVMVTVQVDNFTLVDPHEHTDLVDGEGHFHVKLPDGSNPPYVLCTKPYCLVDLSHLDPGLIEVRAMLMDNLHNEIMDDDGDPVEDSFLLTVESGSCTETSALMAGHTE